MEASSKRYNKLARINWPATAFLPSLETLDLTKTILRLIASDAISNSCPALKYWRMSFESRTPQLQVKCPLLEAFEIRTGSGPMGGLSICGCNIKRLRVHQQYFESGPAYLRLSAPALQTLEWQGPLPHSVTVDSLLDSLVSSLTLRTTQELLYLNQNRLLNGDLSLLGFNRLLLPFCETIEIISYRYFHTFFKMKGSFGRGGYWDSHNLSLKQLVQVTVHDFSGKIFEYDFFKFLPGVATLLRIITISADMETTTYFSKIVLEKVEQLQQSFPHIKILLQLHGR